jgi:hypothetical protein
LRAGKPSGFASAPLPDRARGGRATLAFALAGPAPSRVGNLDIVENFLASIAAFCQAATLAAALRAIACLDADKLEGTCDLLVAGSHISARVTAPKPQIAYSALSEAEVLEIALEAQRAARKGRSKRK